MGSSPMMLEKGGFRRDRVERDLVWMVTGGGGG